MDFLPVSKHVCVHAHLGVRACVRVCMFVRLCVSACVCLFLNGGVLALMLSVLSCRAICHAALRVSGGAAECQWGAAEPRPERVDAAGEHPGPGTAEITHRHAYLQTWTIPTSTMFC